MLNYQYIKRLLFWPKSISHHLFDSFRLFSSTTFLIAPVPFYLYSWLLKETAALPISHRIKSKWGAPASSPPRPVSATAHPPVRARRGTDFPATPDSDLAVSYCFHPPLPKASGCSVGCTIKHFSEAFRLPPWWCGSGRKAPAWVRAPVSGAVTFPSLWPSSGSPARLQCILIPCSSWAKSPPSVLPSPGASIIALDGSSTCSWQIHSV